MTICFSSLKIGSLFRASLTKHSKYQCLAKGGPNTRVNSSVLFTLSIWHQKTKCKYHCFLTLFVYRGANMLQNTMVWSHPTAHDRGKKKVWQIFDPAAGILGCEWHQKTNLMNAVRRLGAVNKLEMIAAELSLGHFHRRLRQCLHQTKKPKGFEWTWIG